MKRRADGVCVPDFAKHAPLMWTLGPNGEAAARCEMPFALNDRGQCHLPLTNLAKRSDVGPNKPCPSDPNDKYDLDYLKRNKEKLPPNPVVRYVNAGAQTHGNGTLLRPYKYLQSAITATPAEGVLLLAPGFYSYNIQWRKNLHIVGRCTARVQIAAPAPGPRALHIKATQIVLEGMTIKNGSVYVEHYFNAVFRHVAFEGAKGYALILIRGSNATLEHTKFTRVIGRAVLVQGQSAGKTTTILNSEFSLNHSGIWFLASQNSIVRNNWFIENGTLDVNTRHGAYKSTGKAAIEFEFLNGKAVVERNTIVRNGWYGIAMIENAGEVSIVGNTIEGNGFLKTPKDTDIQHSGIFIRKGSKVDISQNHFISQPSSAMRINALDVKVQNNYLSGFQDGIVLQASSDVAIEGNRFDGQTRDSLRGITSTENQGTLSIENNQMVQMKQHGIHLSQRNHTVQLKSNLLLNIGTNNADEAIKITENIDPISLHYNRIIGSRGTGAHITLSPELWMEANLLSGSGSESPALYLAAISRKTTLLNNTFHNASMGGRIRVQPESASTTMRGNVWTSNLHLGMESEGNLGRVLMEQEQFVGNGNVHLRVLNNKGNFVVKQSTFANAKFSKGIASRNLGWSEGFGVWVGAMGLVRLGYAKNADYPCSLSQQGLVPSLKNGWSLRPIRVPYDLDVCNVWRWDQTYRTDELRIEQSQCSKACGVQKQCSWLWKDPPTNPAKGNWLPDKAVCSSLEEKDTCNQAIPESSPLRTASALQYPTGQCVKLTNDPCQTEAMKECENKKDALGRQLSYCVRTQNAFNGDVSAFCSPWDALDTTCRPNPSQALCPSSLVCLRQGVIQAPMSVYPSDITLEKNVFWGNLGADVFMDMAGQVTLKDNTYNACLPLQGNSSCKPRVGYQPCAVSPENPECKPAQEGAKRGYKKTTLPGVGALIWQNPSPYDFPYDSKLQGSDLVLTVGGQPLLVLPDVCQTLNSQ